MNARFLVSLYCGLTLGLSVVSASWLRGNPTIFWGACDASAVVPLNDDLVAVADDEDNFLRVYSLQRGGQPVASANVSRFLGFKKLKGETDLEGAARLGGNIYWISSHGRNSAAREQPRRQRFFATTGAVRDGRIELEPVGVPYAGLLRDLAEEPRLARFKLAAAAKGAPKTEGALNIEGLVATPDGHLLIGFRNPVPQGRALLVPLLNPAEVVADRRAQFGDPLQLDLGGLGIRGMTRWQDRYLILAGSAGGGGGTRLYEWAGGFEIPRWLREVDFTGLNPEALTPLGDGPEAGLLVLSDDGSMLCDGLECKKLKNAARKRFRAVLLTPAAAVPATAQVKPKP